MKVLLTGMLEVGGTIVACRVHDISRGGACLDAEVMPGIGDSVTLRRGSLVAEGVVAWLGRGRFGIRFAAPIKATELLVQMNHSRRVTEQGLDVLLSVGAKPPSPSR